MNTTFRLAKNSMIAATHRSALAGIASTTTVATISIRPGMEKSQMA
ncbi:MAG: hypothetical protein ING69_13705 [Rhodocyclaceae bacterium]|nr:hypothetical protein [Rhodocyclaceae bacterium]MCA3083699.1 hypothetical protein [Rhodocyclaceae bacterium]